MITCKVFGTEIHLEMRITCNVSILQSESSNLTSRARMEPISILENLNPNTSQVQGSGAVSAKELPIDIKEYY